MAKCVIVFGLNLKISVIVDFTLKCVFVCIFWWNLYKSLISLLFWLPKLMINDDYMNEFNTFFYLLLYYPLYCKDIHTRIYAWRFNFTFLQCKIFKIEVAQIEIIQIKLSINFCLKYPDFSLTIQSVMTKNDYF